MAIAPENRGGANGGPQYNPANVNGQGGNGQSGQAKPGYTGFPYGQNGQLDTQAAGATMAKDMPSVASRSARVLPGLGEITPLDAPSQDDLPISDGVDIGRGRDSSALPGRVTNPINNNENIDLIKRYLPDLENATRMPNAPDSYKRFINYLKEQIL